MRLRSCLLGAAVAAGVAGATAVAGVAVALAGGRAGGVQRTTEGSSFYLSWEPRPVGASRTLVSLHGHQGSAQQDTRVWMPYATARRFRLISPQWWVGTGDRTEDYLSPPALYRTIDAALRARGATPGTVLLHGFSRGATLTYSLAAIDSEQGRWFGAVLANAGGAHFDFPPTGDVERGRHGATPFAGQRWVLYCGGRDPEPDLNGCPAMRKAEAWVRSRGATATLIEEEGADHGGFHHDGHAVDRALDVWLAP